MKRIMIAILFAASLVLATAPASAHGGDRLEADLSGANEVGGGDTDGEGEARVWLDADEGEVCFRIKVEDIATPRAAHIHDGVAGMNGGVVVDLEIGENGLRGCVEASADLIEAIEDDPSGFYVNVHNADFPGGAVRGQLEDH